jgi:hypothetical protein
MPRSSIPTLPALLLGAILPGSAHGSSPQEQTLEAALWQALDGQPRSILLGSYVLEVRERVVEDPDMERFIPAIVPSPRAEAVAWLYRALNGAHVRYDEFLGAERIRFERSLAFRVGTEQLAHAEVDGIIGQVYDTDHDGRLGRRELERGNAAMERFFCARVRSEIPSDQGFHALPPLHSASAFAAAWLDHEARIEARDAWDCPDCAGVPHLDKLAALVAFLQEYSPPMAGAHTQLFAPGHNQLFLTVDAHPHRGSTLRVEDADGRSYWDLGSLPHSDAALDGRVDLVTSHEAFPGASYNQVTGRWERYQPGPGNQWMYEVLVDLAHAHLPRRLQVAEPLRLEPELEVPAWFEREIGTGFAFDDSTRPSPLGPRSY